MKKLFTDILPGNEIQLTDFAKKEGERLFKELFTKEEQQKINEFNKNYFREKK